MTEQTQAPAPTVEQLVATFGELDDAALQKLHDDEKAAEGGGRTTLLDAIHREQQNRTEAAEKSKADQEAADAKARDAGYADAAAQRTAEEAAAKAGAAKKRTAAKKPAAKKSAGFDVAADAGEYLQGLAKEGGTVTVTLGDDNRPDANLTAIEVTLAFTRGKPVNRDQVAVSTAGLPGFRRFTHAYALDGKTVLGKRELASPLPLSPGEQVAFPAGSLAF